ncbi:hypothetical protein LTR78_006897 [Recurvomyces mirabilis]|uniref:Uncharacterized protein n=1 Tax=Recurvomyces mirabilis TaxID=574656 RepID=A0AAE0WKF2_9PEZI|nr:hypothetical protein LTR78_006897 [Recurvomyces mirabilis]KAK5153112.1 hypothetical protein LTS14_007756 [Recurvomyces mirabilis]
MTDASQTASTNALSILLDAAPSDVAKSVESVISSLSTAFAGPSASPSNTPLIPTSLTSQPTRPTSFSTSAMLPSSVTPDSSLPTKISSPTPSTMMTVASQPITTSTSTSTPAPTAASTSHGAGQLKNASVVGIATGLVAGAVLIFLIGIFLWRRRSQGKAPFANRRPSQRSSRKGSKRVYPEEAFLYDPKMTPRAASPSLEGERHSRDESATSLIPDPRRGTVELSSAPPSPPQRPTSPLLSPVAVAEERRSHNGSPSRERRNSGGGSPSGRRSRSSLAVSRTDLTRPMSAIWEEPPRPSVDARTGLLSPGPVNMARHSA